MGDSRHQSTRLHWRGICYKHGERTIGNPKEGENHEIEKSDQAPQEGQEAGAHQAAAEFHKVRNQIRPSET
jgi:hypothetical protein